MPPAVRALARMARQTPLFPPDVAEALQEPAGTVSLRYTRSESLTGPPAMDIVLMETPYERVLAALTLDTKLNLRFIRTGNREEGARVALVNVAPLLDAGRNWHIELSWDRVAMSISVRDQHDPDGRVFEGRVPPRS
jgi:hypothetical protein